MEALWGSAFLVAALLLTAALCVRCHRHRGPGAAVDPSMNKPNPALSPSSFQLLPPTRYPSHVPPQPRGPVPETIPNLNLNPNLNLHLSWGQRGHADTGSPQSSQQRRVSTARTEPDRGSPTCLPESEDDYSNEVYASGYVKVIPDPQDAGHDGHNSPTGDSGSAATPTEQYENVPDVSRRSLGDSLEYINVPTAGSSPASRYGSDRDSDADGPDYENVTPPRPHGPP
nr:TPA_inf: linker for activation of T cells [Numida meleagris]